MDAIGLQRDAGGHTAAQQKGTGVVLRAFMVEAAGVQ